MNDEDVPRTVWLDSADVFLRRTLRRSGDRGGGGGPVIAKDKLDLVGDVVRARDEREAVLVGDLEGIRSTEGLGGDCSIGCRSECRCGRGELRGVKPRILATRFDTVELRSRSRG